MIPIDTAKLKSKKDYALAYASIGWHVLPLWWMTKKGECACGKCSDSNNSRGKHPITAKGQNEASTDKDVIERWWDRYPDANIGVYLAPSNMVAVDIDPRNGGMDSIEQLEDKHGKIESDVLQFTGGGGEHRVFYIPEGTQNLPGTLGAGIDLKRNGYIVVEPSNHFSGLKYNWEGSSNPLEGIAPSPLPDWIRDLATSKSTKDADAKPISRYVTEEQIKELRSALYFIDTNNRTIWERVGACLKTIGAAGWNLWYEYSERDVKFDLNDQLRVWRSFNTKHLNIETIFYMAQEAGWRNITVDVDIDLSFLDAKKEREEDKVLTKLPGILGEIEEYYNASAKIPQPKFAQQTAFGLLSVMLGRKFSTVYGDFTSLYFLNIAKTACGKEHIKFTTEKVLTACNMDHLLAGDGYTSAGAVVSVLEVKPAHISVIDELGLYLEAVQSKSGQNQKGANVMLMECIGRLNGDVRSKNYSTQSGISKNESKVIKHPAITLQSMTTPSTFYDNMNVAMIKDGFLGRFILTTSKRERVAPRRVKPLDVPQAIINWANAINYRVNDVIGAFTNPGIVGEINILDISPDADEVLQSFSEEMVLKMSELDSTGMEGIIGRYGEFAGRLALIIALSVNPMATSISKSDALVAVEYMRDRANETITEIKEHLTGSEYHKMKQEVLIAISASKCGVTDRDMHRIAPFSKFKTKELSEVLKSLKSAELIALVNTRQGKPGKPRMAYVALNWQIDNELSKENVNL